MTRPTLDEWYMAQARVVAMRSTCLRRKVGAIVVDGEGIVLSAGYNGVPRGWVHCDEQPCSAAFSSSGADLDRCMALHAEQNAIARLERPRDARVIYVTTEPCIACTKLLLATAISRVVYDEEYSSSGRALYIRSGRTWNKL